MVCVRGDSTDPTLAIELKRRAPNAHTFLEVIKARYGILAHMVFMIFELVINILGRYSSSCRLYDIAKRE